MTLSLPDGPPAHAAADPDRLRQIIGNLVSNAIRHTPPGGLVTLRPVPNGVEVADTGTGIVPEDLPRVFDLFWRADASRSRATGGSGLGLAIARKLAQAHAGDLRVSSTPGAGAVFTLTLPPTDSSRGLLVARAPSERRGRKKQGA